MTDIWICLIFIGAFLIGGLWAVAQGSYDAYCDWTVREGERPVKWREFVFGKK